MKLTTILENKKTLTCYIKIPIKNIVRWKIKFHSSADLLLGGATVK